jgi:Rrf2 family transcriptional regulator, repressor of oqxAB
MILAEYGSICSVIDVRFPTALQIMLSLALADRNSISQLSSAELAKSLGANPSFVRKLLVPLVQSKLLRSQMGKAGGVRLARPADEITLRDIYCAVVADTKIWAPRTGIPKRCLVSSNVQGYFEELIDDAQDAILSMLPLHARRTHSATGPHRIGDSRERKTPAATHEEGTRLRKASAAIELLG